MSFGVFQFRRGTAAQWTAANTVLADGELGLETDTAKFKVGNGTTAWNLLPYGGIKGDMGSITTATASGATTAPVNTLLLATGTFTVTLPVQTNGAQLTVKNVGTGVVTVVPQSGTIDGAANYTLDIQYEALSVVSDGTNWYVI